MTHATPALAADSVVVNGESRAIARRAGTAERPILRLEGSTSREDAEALRGAELRVPAAPLEEDEYWARDLVGCTVVDGEREVGEELIPLVRDAIRSIDRDARVIDVDMAFVRG